MQYKRSDQAQQVVHCIQQDVGDPTACVAIAKAPVPEPGESEALVEMILRPINPADLRSLQGLFAGFHPASLPAIPGIEGVGRIAGPCAKFEVGQRVVSTAWPLGHGQGTWQEFCVAPLDQLYAVPDALSDWQAAIFWSNPVTAVGLLKTAKMRKGAWLLQTAAGSAIGRQIIQVARDYGIRTINVIRANDQREELLRLGADCVVCSGEDDLEQIVADATQGQGAYACFDAVGGSQFQSLVKCVRKGGDLILYSGLAGPVLTAGVADIIYSSRSIRGFRMTPWFMSNDQKSRDAIVKEVFRLLADVIQPFHGPAFPLEQVKDAIEEANRSGRKEKVYLSSRKPF